MRVGRTKGRAVLGALLTAGDAVTKTDGIWHLNKKEIINCPTMNLMETQSAYMILTKDLLLKDAAGFIRTFTPTGKEQLNSFDGNRPEGTRWYRPNGELWAGLSYLYRRPRSWAPITHFRGYLGYLAGTVKKTGFIYKKRVFNSPPGGQRFGSLVSLLR